MHKGHPFECTFHSLPTHRHTDAQPCLTLDADTSYMPAKFWACSPIQFKVKLAHSNGYDCPLSGLKLTPDCYCFGYHKDTSWHTRR